MKSRAFGLAVSARVFFAVLTLSFALSAYSTAQNISSQPQTSKAPLNPHFVEHMNARAQGLAPSPATVGGYSLGLIPSRLDLSHLKTQTPTRPAATAISLPISYDLRTLGKVTPVRNQGTCGACWAFADFGSMESALLPSETRDFSENNLKNLSGFDFGACGGGDWWMSAAYLARWDGPVNESDDPYNPNSNVSPAGLPVQKHLQDVVVVAGRSGPTDNANLKLAVMTYGGLATDMYVDPTITSFSQTTSDWNPQTAAYYWSGSSVLIPNHTVTLVGWDDNYSASNFSTPPPGPGAFLIKNSWGTSFGNSGYFWVSYYDVMYTSTESVAFVGSEAVTDYTRQYSYDPLGWIDSYTADGSSTAYFANVFTAVASEQLIAVSTYVASNNSPYQIDVYTDVTGAPNTGNWAVNAHTTGTFATAGYHTVILANPVSLTAGHKFAVRIYLTTPGYNYPVPVEDAVNGFSSQATASPGQSFIASSTFFWTDTTSLNPTMNVALKAFTGTVTALSPSVSTTGAGLIASTTAELNGTVNPNGRSTYAWFEWGTDSTLTNNLNSTLQATMGSGTSPVAIWQSLTRDLNNLTPSTTYYFRVVASNSIGTARGSILSFRTNPTNGVPPTVTTKAATSVTASGVSLNGSVYPNGSATWAWFELTTDSTFTTYSWTWLQPMGSGTALLSLTAGLNGLAPNTTYYFRAAAINNAGTVRGSILSFTTTSPVGTLPGVVTLPVGSFTSSWGSLSGSVNPNGSATWAWFEWSTDSGFATYNFTFQQSIGSGNTAQAVTATVAGLSPNTLYYFRLVASNSAGTTRSTILNFTTISQSGALATVTTNPASTPSVSGGSLNGSVNPNLSATWAWFEWSTDSTLSVYNSTSPHLIGSGNSPLLVTSNLTGLWANTTYYFRAVAGNAAGTTRGSILSFTTASALPIVVTTAPTLISTTGGTMNGLANPNGTATDVWFEWGTSSNLSSYNSTGPLTISGTGTYYIWYGLTQPTGTYYYRIAASNSVGVVRGSIFSFTTQAKDTSGALQFVPILPCRVVDTRWTAGELGGPAIAGQTSRTFVVPDTANCFIPSTAAAFSLNATVIPWGTLGYLTIWPSGQPQPFVSTLNSLDGRIKANAAIVPAGPGGAISVYVTDTSDVVLDINGYFVPGPDPSGLAFYPLTPCRIADTRGPDAPLGGPYIVGGQSRTLPILSSSCQIPSSAQAYSLNLTAVPRGRELGWLSAWPTGLTWPGVSTLNALTGTYTANAAIVPAGINGAIDVMSVPGNDTDVVIDINGYFAPAASAPGGLSLYTLAPCRVVDTRNTTGSFNGTLLVDVKDSSCGVSSSAQAFALNASVDPGGSSLGFLTLWPNGQAQPFVSTLNALDGMITSNMAIVPTANGSIDAFSTSATELWLDINGYFAP